MSGIIAVYALVIAVLIAGNLEPPPGKSYSLFNGFMHLASGLSVGLSGVAAGYAIGVVGDTVSDGSGVVVQGGASTNGFTRASEHTCSSRASSSVGSARLGDARRASLRRGRC